MRRYLIVLGALALLLSGCQAEARELPPPAELLAAIQADVDLPELVDTAETDLEALTGVGPETCDSAVCCRLREGVAPDELIIVRAASAGDADQIQELLEQRLDHKREAGALYLTEYQPMLQAGVVRRDGLTVSLIVSGQVEEIIRVYDDSLRAVTGPG